MADGAWGPQAALYPPGTGMLKRPRADYDQQPPSGMGPGQDAQHLVREDDRGGPMGVKDTKSLVSAYDRYLQGSQVAAYAPGEASNVSGPPLGRPVPMGDPSFMGHPGPIVPDLYGRGVGFGGHLPLDAMARQVREPLSLPPDATNTLYVEGLPPNCTKREVAHIFRPFVGYKEVRLVNKEPKHRGGDPLILCFVDFVDPACAATALSALQGYKMDENDPDSSYLRIQFSRYPGARSGGGPRGRR